MNLRKRVERLEAKVAPPRNDFPTLSDSEWLEFFDSRANEAGFADGSDYPAAAAAYRTALASGDRHAIDDAWDFLCRLSLHHTDGGPRPVSEGEFKELATWYDQNESLLLSVAGGQSLDLGNGRCAFAGDLRNRIRLGHRASDAAEWAEDVRRLRASLRDERI
jgi:hypothetical protein